MSDRIQITDPRTGRRKSVSRAVLAASCRLTARRAHQEPSAMYRSQAQIWYRIGDRAGLSLREMTDATTGANGAI